MNTTKRYTLLFIIILFSFTGCSLYDVKNNNTNSTHESNQEENSSEEGTSSTSETEDKATDSVAMMEETPIETAEDEIQAEEIEEETEEEPALLDNATTPYQFLNMMVGNAEQIFCEYTITQAADNREDRATFYHQGDKTAVIFTTYGMDIDQQTVQEIEKDGKVYYYMWDKEKVVSYLAPAHDIFIYTLMQVLNAELISSTTEDSFIVYEYSVPFIQDESISIGYRFYMGDNVLKKVTLSVNGDLSQTYVFSDFLTDPLEDSVFEYPIDMPLTEYDYSYSDDSMAPWWE